MGCAHPALVAHAIRCCSPQKSHHGSFVELTGFATALLNSHNRTIFSLTLKPTLASGTRFRPQGRNASKPMDGRVGLRVREKMVRPERFELPTPWFEAKYSIQLSYGRIVKLALISRISRIALQALLIG